MRQPRSVTILGATGSVGQSTVDLIKSTPDQFHVRALTAQKSVQRLAEQALALRAEYAVIGDDSLYQDLKEALSGTNVKPMAGASAIVEAAAMPSDWTMAAIVGAAGVRATLRAIENGKTVALANKESLVCAGKFMMQAVEKSGATLLPVDSEHNAIFQVFEEKNRAAIKRLILTASGGPFLYKSRSDLAGVTPEQAVRHPNWSMGAKISVDSATMMNKSLEIIEAKYLFKVKNEEIDVVIHPQSIIHSMVEYIDGSILAQMGAPDMRTPIAQTLAWPSRMQTTGETLNLNQKMNLTFESIDLKRFPFVKMAQDVLSGPEGGAVVFNAANEVAVAAFLDKKLAFLEIENIVANTLDHLPPGPISSIEDVFDLDRQARETAHSLVLAQTRRTA